jgi:hypothetical protein
MENEIWKQIKDFEELYEVSNLGRVRSLGSTFKGGYGQVIRKPGKELAKIKASNGYPKAHLWHNQKAKLLSIHRLVAETFIPNPDNLPHVNHKDGNKENNHVENLEWCTPAENNRHAIDNNLIKNAKGRDMSAAFKRIVMKDLLGSTIKTFESLKHASKETGIAASNISMCAKGRLKRAGNYVWEYEEL